MCRRHEILILLHLDLYGTAALAVNRLKDDIRAASFSLVHSPYQAHECCLVLSVDKLSFQLYKRVEKENVYHYVSQIVTKVVVFFFVKYTDLRIIIEAPGKLKTYKYF